MEFEITVDCLYPNNTGGIGNTTVAKDVVTSDDAPVHGCSTLKPLVRGTVLRMFVQQNSGDSVDYATRLQVAKIAPCSGGLVDPPPPTPHSLQVRSRLDPYPGEHVISAGKVSDPYTITVPTVILSWGAQNSYNPGIIDPYTPDAVMVVLVNGVAMLNSTPITEPGLIPFPRDMDGVAYPLVNGITPLWPDGVPQGPVNMDPGDEVQVEFLSGGPQLNSEWFINMVLEGPPSGQDPEIPWQDD